MKIVKSYENYNKFKKELKTKKYNILNDTIGQYNDRDYSVDITLRDYDGILCVDYDVYKINGNEKYLDGGKICEVSKMPFTENGFWKLIKRKFVEHIGR